MQGLPGIYIFLFVFHVMFAIIVACLGDHRKIGFDRALAWSLFLSPIVGMIMTFMSEKEDPVKETPSQTEG